MLYLFLINTGESKGIGIPILSKDLKGSNWNIKHSERFLVTSTSNAPLVPDEGRIVPERYVSESMCLKITSCPKQTKSFYLLNYKNFKVPFDIKLKLFLLRFCSCFQYLNIWSLLFTIFKNFSQLIINLEISCRNDLKNSISIIFKVKDIVISLIFSLWVCKSFGSQ